MGWFPGQQGAVAIAEVLAGKSNPSGRLPLSYPRNSQQLPVYYYQRAASKQDNYYDEPGAPLHEFGYGLSYTTFVYENLQVQKDSDQFKVTVTLTNQGKRAGQESVLLFVRLQGGRVIQRYKMLKDFTKVGLQPGESTNISFYLSPEQLLYTDQNRRQKVASNFTVMLGNLTVDCSVEENL